MHISLCYNVNNDSIIVQIDFFGGNMREIGFSELFSTSVNIHNIAAVERQWKNGNTNKYPSGRDENILSYTINGIKRLYIPDSDKPYFDLAAPSVILIAKGSPYISQTVLDEKNDMGHTICIRFKISDDDGEELIIRDRYISWKSDDNDTLLKLFRQVLNSYLEVNINNLMLKAHVYRLFYELSGQLQSKFNPHPGFENLLPAMEYIKNNPSSNISVADLAGMCFMSESYFRKRFKDFTGGICLTDYRNKIRIEKATDLLDSSLWTTDLVARTLGFYDTSHFYRIYKKFTGSTPRKNNS